MYLKYQYETCINHVANTVPLCYPFLNFKNYKFKLKMPRSLFFKMFITIGIQANPYYSVTLCDMNVHVLSSHIQRCCYRHAFCLHCIILDCCLNFKPKLCLSNLHW